MGIPGLLGHMRPYSIGEPWNLDKTPKVRAIIDGPALAYYIYYRCLAQYKDAVNALAAVPDYSFLCDSALAFLLLLEQHGLDVHRIFFDGALPSSKSDIRMERLQRSVNEMRGFKNLNPVLSDIFIPSDKKVGQTSRVFADTSARISARLKTIPAAPFIVPAIRDCLLHSKYAHSVKVVPCEADLACTSPSLCQPSDIIMTSDSDLLLQMPAASIVFFNEIFFNEISLVLQRYDCKEIALRLNVSKEQMVLLGYHLQQDAHIALTECARRAREGQSLEQTGFLQFSKQYHPLAKEIEWSDVFSTRHYKRLEPSAARLANAVRSLDPRVLEALVNGGQDGNFRLFLPPLFEDPARSTAWLPSARIRLLAFQLWIRSTRVDKNQRRTFEEFSRHGLSIRSKSSTIDDAALSSLDEELNNLPNHISHLSEKFSQLSKSQAWSIIVLITFLEEARSSDTLPDRKDIAKLICQKREIGQQVSVSWSQIHLNAQLEACFYSLRILKQLCELASIVSGKDARFERHITLLQGMPLLQDILSVPTQGMDLSAGGSLLQAELRTFYPDFDALKEAQDPPKESKAARKKRKAAQAAQHESRKTPKGTGNMFDVLAEEM